MADRSGVLYVDTSALVKLVIPEPESEAVEAELPRWAGVATGALSAVELGRTLLRAADMGRAVGSRTPGAVLSGLAHVPLGPRVLAVAAQIDPPMLRSLDAMHLACALALGADLGGVMTYDDRLARAAEHHGLRVVAPV